MYSHKCFWAYLSIEISKWLICPYILGIIGDLRPEAATHPTIHYRSVFLHTNIESYHFPSYLLKVWRAFQQLVAATCLESLLALYTSPYLLQFAVTQTCWAGRLSFLSLPITSASLSLPRNKQFLSQSHLPMKFFWLSQAPRFCLPCMSIVLFNKRALILILIQVFIIWMYAFLMYSKKYRAPAMNAASLQTIGKDGHYVSNNNNMWLSRVLWKCPAGDKASTLWKWCLIWNRMDNQSNIYCLTQSMVSSQLTANVCWTDK